MGFTKALIGVAHTCWRNYYGFQISLLVTIVTYAPRHTGHWALPVNMIIVIMNATTLYSFCAKNIIHPHQPHAPHHSADFITGQYAQGQGLIYGFAQSLVTAHCLQRKLNFSDLTCQITDLQSHLDHVLSSSIWKYFTPLRQLFDTFKSAFNR